MTWREVIEIGGVFILSAVKFGLAGVPSAVFANWSIFKVLTVTICGGVTGTIVFTYLSEGIIKSYKKLTQTRQKLGMISTKPKRKFTFTNKSIIKVKRKFGLLGVAILTPSVLSIPVGCFLAVRYFKQKDKIIRYMFISIIAWAVILYFFFNYFYHLIF